MSQQKQAVSTKTICPVRDRGRLQDLHRVPEPRPQTPILPEKLLCCEILLPLLVLLHDLDACLFRFVPVGIDVMEGLCEELRVILSSVPGSVSIAVKFVYPGIDHAF